MAADETSESVEDLVARRVAEALQAKADKDERDKKLKGLGLTQEVLDTIADAVWDRGEARQAERKKAAEDADQEPSRKSEKKPGFLQSIGLASNDD